MRFSRHEVWKNVDFTCECEHELYCDEIEANCEGCDEPCEGCERQCINNIIVQEYKDGIRGINHSVTTAEVIRYFDNLKALEIIQSYGIDGTPEWI